MMASDRIDILLLSSAEERKIVAAFRGMHVSPAKHSSASVTDGQTDGRTTDKVIWFLSEFQY